MDALRTNGPTAAYYKTYQLFYSAQQEYLKMQHGGHFDDNNNQTFVTTKIGYE